MAVYVQEMLNSISVAYGAGRRAGLAGNEEAICPHLQKSSFDRVLRAAWVDGKMSGLQEYNLRKYPNVMSDVMILALIMSFIIASFFLLGYFLDAHRDAAANLGGYIDRFLP